MPDHRVAVTAVDFSDPQLVVDYLDLLDAYARDPMGGGVGLTDAVRTRLPIDLASNPAAHVLLARDASGAVGMATCFVGYSTFRALPLLGEDPFLVVNGTKRSVFCIYILVTEVFPILTLTAV